MKKEDFTHVDWEKEIVEVPLKTKRGRLNRSLNATMTWAQIEGDFMMRFEESEDPQEKANILRMLQYFLGKFIFHHALIYDKEINWNDNFDPLAVLNTEGLPESKLPLSRIKQLEKLFHQHENKRRKEEKAKDGGYQEVKKMFEAHGLKVYKPKGLRKEGDRDTVCVKHDGVRYHISIMKDKAPHRKAKVEQKVAEHKVNMERYHDFVKPIYEEISKRYPGDVWAMEGGGAQVQMFFGNEDGYIGILYLDMRKANKLRDSHRMVLENPKADELIGDMQIPGLTISTYQKHWAPVFEDKEN